MNSDRHQELASLNPCGSLPQHFNEKEVAQQLGVSVAALRRWRSERRGPVYRRLGTRVVYAETDVIAWLNSCPNGGGRLNADLQAGMVQ